LNKNNNLYNDKLTEQKKKDYDLTFKESSTTNLSSWFSNFTKPIKFEKLNEDISVDIVIVGGGISGLTTGYILSKEGKSVAIVEDGYIGSGETSHTTAHITAALDDRYYNLEETFGIERARIAAQSHTHAIKFIESVVIEENINCNFERVDGYLFLDPTDTTESIKKELKATHRIGLNTHLVDSAPIDSFTTGLCLKFSNQGQFHPLKYLKGLSTAIVNRNGRIFTETHAQEIADNVIETSDGYKITAKKIIIATNAPVIDKTSKIYEKQIPYRTYVIGALIKKDSIPTALYWDTGNKNSKDKANPYHYVRIQKLEYDDKTKESENDKNNNQYDILIVGGEDHKTGNTQNNMEERHDRLIEWTKTRFPIEKVVYRWSGQVMEPLDSLAFIGLNPSSFDQENKNNNIYIATGDSGNGITHGTIAGILLSDLIMGRKNEWSKVYDPARTIENKEKKDEDDSHDNKDDKNRKEENGNSSFTTTVQTNKTQTLSSIKDELSVEQGMIIQENPDDPIAVYKDIDGNLHTFSAKCTHMGCTVKWNSLEKSFDCPCHGSRFYYNGKVINAPANNSLSAKKLE
jgi:glycine/D-amino acid oxidase-like deaminating enzyme/nitrite reductase/ring-hydroxylating ferredoxin subunit